jgi:hypothetical protein
MMPHLKPYTNEWLSRGQDICVSQQCHLSYGIKPFKDEVVCDVSPLEVYDVLSMSHAIYESCPHNVIVTLEGNLYRIPEVAPTISTSLILEKK